MFKKSRGLILIELIIVVAIIIIIVSIVLHMFTGGVLTTCP